MTLPDPSTSSQPPLDLPFRPCGGQVQWTLGEGQGAKPSVAAHLPWTAPVSTTSATPLALGSGWHPDSLEVFWVHRRSITFAFPPPPSTSHPLPLTLNHISTSLFSISLPLLSSANLNLTHLILSLRRRLTASTPFLPAYSPSPPSLQRRTGWLATDTLVCWLRNPAIES